MSEELTEYKTSIEKMKSEVKELYSDELLAFNRLLDREPPKEWIKNNRGAKYIPIRRNEQTIRSIFGAFQVIHVGNCYLIGNSVCKDIELKVFNPILKEWLSYAGTGAVPIQTEKGAGPLEFDKINSMALHKNAPAALGFAFSNACHKIGRIFGSHVNTPLDESIDIMDVYSVKEVNASEEKSRILNHIKNAKTVDDLMQAEPHIGEDTELKVAYKEKETKLYAQ